MAIEFGDGVKFSLISAGDLSAKQFHFVKLDANGKAVICAAATDIPVGVVQNNPTAGQPATIMSMGTSKISSGAALNEGDLIGTSAAGLAAALVAGTDTTKYVVGQMLTATGGASVIGTATINCGAPHRAA